MRLFGYYALHSFINQLRKLFKTWVLIFLIVCMAMGGLIGFGAAMLDETIEEQDAASEVGELPEEEQDEEGFQLPIEPNALIELIAGAAVLGVFVFEAVSADKNGSKIFLPADVNLLFSSPMKPQSVLMFRLATQLGTAILASIYIAFQLPNLILNLGVSVWTAVAILVTWFGTILVGKLLQVLLYTVCSTHLGFKKYLSRGVYAVLLLLGGSFLAFYKASGLDPLTAADRFLNAPYSRYIPFWGWLKGLCAYSAEQNWAMAGLCIVLLSVGNAVMVYLIWQLKADFYEDAMAKSEETAALLEKARSEKSSGVAATKQRKKERKDSIRRDGMSYGQGANVFFVKTMYNRFRFAHFGVLTKTMETYLAAALGVAALCRFYLDADGVLPVCLTLGGFVFFRAMGNPLAEDTSMDFFRLIPESTWKKLFYSLLGGTVNCLLDVLFPMLFAAALLGCNPLKLLVWLPVIVSVDFYATSVGAFIDLSVPVSAGKTIKTIVQIMFIYFGLLPDIGVLAFGIVLGYTLEAAVISTAINLGFGFLFFSLASIFLEPKGKDVIDTAANVDLAAASKRFSRLGFALFAYLGITTALQFAASALAGAFFPSVFETAWGIWIFTFAPQYAIAVPIALLIAKKVPAQKPAVRKMGIANGVRFGFICVFMMYGGNILGSIITALLGLVVHTTVENPLMSYVTGDSILLQILFMVILAPVFEELVFRKTLIDRMNRYGGKTAVIVSGLIFGLFHGNLSQFFYAFALGLVFGYVYLKTGNIRYTITAHMIINLFGSVISTELLKRVPLDQIETNPEALLSPWTAVFGGYVITLILSAITGLVLLCMYARKLSYPAASESLPEGQKMRTVWVNPGMLLFAAACIAMMLYSILG